MPPGLLVAALWWDHTSWFWSKGYHLPRALVYLLPHSSSSQLSSAAWLGAVFWCLCVKCVMPRGPDEGTSFWMGWLCPELCPLQRRHRGTCSGAYRLSVSAHPPGTSTEITLQWRVPPRFSQLIQYLLYVDEICLFMLGMWYSENPESAPGNGNKASLRARSALAVLCHPPLCLPAGVCVLPCALKVEWVPTDDQTLKSRLCSSQWDNCVGYKMRIVPLSIFFNSYKYFLSSFIKCDPHASPSCACGLFLHSCSPRPCSATLHSHAVVQMKNLGLKSAIWFPLKLYGNLPHTCLGSWNK